MIWSALLLLLVGGLVSYYAGPKTDYFYNRFTTQSSQSLILGSSRAAQGIDPNSLKTEWPIDLYNFSFTYYNSPYGECYLEASRKKFNEKEGGTFILEVNPFILSNYKENMTSEEETFGECETAPSNMWLMNTNPNFEYIIRNYVEDFKSLIGIKPRPFAIYLHESGWLEVDIPHDTVFFKENTEEKVKNYNVLVKKMKPSTARWKALEKTIKFFSEYGEVHLVRIPVSPEMEEIERKYYPNFEEEIRRLSSDLRVDYFSFFNLNDSLYFTDGNHLYRSSAQEFSKILGREIREVSSKFN
ncbi:MAG: hypothetical protein MK086_05045 [Flavobacteriales bacterium]|nr:hypothetical protein [Flavobacteriales bacterium]